MTACGAVGTSPVSTLRRPDRFLTGRFAMDS